MKGWLWQPIDIASLVFFRIAFGILAFADLLGGFIYYHFWVGAFQPENFQFTYYGFAWVRPFPEPLMSLFFLIGLGASLAVAVGWRYRITAPLLAMIISYYFLLEKAHYLNHGYFFCWLAWLMVLLPAWRAFSVDVWRRPTERSAIIPRWCLAVLPFLMGVVYFFGGLAKLNPDWLYYAMPLKLWLKSKSNLFLIGPLLAKEATAWVMSWGGAALDLSITFLMLWRPTRKLGFGLAVGFHLTNHLVFNIGIFPYLSVVLTSLFFAPNWPRQAMDWGARHWPRLALWQGKWQQGIAGSISAPSRFWQQETRWHSPILLGLVVLIVVHCSVPLRHHLYASDVAWSEEGHRYAWRMMLRSKRGRGHYIVEDKTTGERSKVYPKRELLSKQARKLWTHPDMILQYAHHLRDQAAAEGQSVAIYAKVRIRLNDGKYYPYVIEEIDLAQEEWSFWQANSWILPEGTD